MDRKMIRHIRKGLEHELVRCDGKARRLNVQSELAEEILFNIDENGMKTFAFPLDLMKKVNYEGISFDNFFAYGFDFTGFKGISLDPQKVYDKDLSYANLNGVTIINTFDDVKLDGVQSEGMIYKTFEIRAKKYAKTMKK